MSSVLEYIHRTAVAGSLEDLTDGQLLECFLGRHEEAAFAALVRRHGPMVLGVCRRLLQQVSDAEDAFQATWFVLLERARAIRKREALGSWLYGVAYRTALKARAEAARRRGYEGPLREVPMTPAITDLAAEELRTELDAEVNRLACRYRAPIVLCYFENKTYAEAAKLLGLAPGTVASRLARARELLRKRLARRGLGLSAGLLATLLGQDSPAAAVPGPLMNSLLIAAADLCAGKPLAAVAPEPILALAKGVIKTMLLTKLTTVAAFLILLGIAGAGAGLVATSAAAPQTADGARRGGEIDDLRKELQEARQEIEQLKLALRRAQQPASQPRPRLYRGKPVRHWVEQLTDGDPSYRKEAIVVLGVISRDDQTVIESLLAALRDQDEEVRLAAAHSLGDAGAPAVPRLMALLKPEGATSTLAALALANVGAPAKAAVPALIELLHSRNRQARQAAATALARIGPAAKAALPALVQALKNDGDDREAVAEALVQLDPATSAHFGTLRGTPGVLKDMTKEWQKAAEELEKKYPPQAKEEPRQ